PRGSIRVRAPAVRFASLLLLRHDDLVKRIGARDGAVAIETRHARTPTAKMTLTGKNGSRAAGVALARSGGPARAGRVVDPELGDGGRAARRGDHQRDAIGADEARPMELPLAHGGAGGDRRPDTVRPRLDVVLGRPLAERDRLLNADEIERAQPAQIDLDPSAGLSGRGRPERVGLAVDGGCGRIGG